MSISTNTAASRGIALASPFALVDAVRTRIARHLSYRRTLKELSQLSARELDDLGLTRGQLGRVAYQAACEGTARR